MYPFFDRTFIVDSFSCRKDKGTHKAINRFRAFAYKVSKNNTHSCWVLKCDIIKFFASIDHTVLREILARYIEDADMLWLLGQVIESFRPGLPLGNLTSQLLVNVYMNEFDQFVKHQVKAQYYIRYADDFVVLSRDRQWLEQQIESIRRFLAGRLRLTLHPTKITIQTWASGVDFLGYVHFPDHRVLRTRTKRRMFARVGRDNLSSYLGLLKHCHGYKLKQKLVDLAEIGYH